MSAPLKYPREMVGLVFGRLTVIAEAERRRPGDRRLVCLCRCGTSTNVSRGNLFGGLVRSCGCLQKDAPPGLRHGAARDGRLTPEYSVYRSMRARCLSPSHRDYTDYGGRGIAICEGWLGDFQAFLADMGKRPSASHSIDRINVNGNYEPSNCRWATAKEQARNTRRSRLVTVGDTTLCMAAWCEHLGLKPETVKGRLKRGWPAERALGLAGGPS